MNVSNVNSAPTYQPPQAAQTRPPQSVDRDGDTDDGASKVSSAKAEVAQPGKLNVTA